MIENDACNLQVYCFNVKRANAVPTEKVNDVISFVFSLCSLSAYLLKSMHTEHLAGVYYNTLS